MATEHAEEAECAARRMDELRSPNTEGSLFHRSCLELAGSNRELAARMEKLGEMLRLESGEPPSKDPIAASALASFCYVACTTSQGGSLKQPLPLSLIYLTTLRLAKTYNPGLLRPDFTDHLGPLFESLVRFHDPLLWWHVTQGGKKSWSLGESPDFLHSLLAGPLSRRGRPELCRTFWARLARNWDPVDVVFFALGWVLRHSEDIRKVEDARSRGHAVLSMEASSDIEEVAKRAACLKAFTPKSVLRTLQTAICGAQHATAKQDAPPCLLVGPDDALAASDGLNTGQLCVLIDVRPPRARTMQPSLRGSMEFDVEAAGSAEIATLVNRSIATQKTYATRELPDGKRGCVALLLYNSDGFCPRGCSLYTVIALLIEAGVAGVCLLDRGYASVAELRGDQPLPSQKEILLGQVSNTLASLQETANQSLRLAGERLQGSRSQTATKLEEVRIRLGDVSSTAAASVKTQSAALAETANATLEKFREGAADPNGWWGQASSGFKSMAARMQQAVASPSFNGAGQPVPEAPSEYAVRPPPSLSFDRAPSPPDYTPPCDGGEAKH
ncbi:hypothetical protein FOL47_005045 [Perkinsus chesapeaki]|uniref:Uncharacterized protein n=1 Tax=Perkinsus chesapeaki TaxID=330153 RepID=A0A7J6LZA6_PERCH|nr:hypothetical protein FOL47_005045 [Perkinsus chesapeaki]